MAKAKSCAALAHVLGEIAEWVGAQRCYACGACRDEHERRWVHVFAEAPPVAPLDSLERL